MIVGYSIKQINPKIGCQMEGYEPRYSVGIHDDITVSALAINNSFLFISMDLIAVPGYRCDRIKRKIQEEFSIQPDHIVISAIHTHSGPTVTDLLLDYPEIDADYWRQIEIQTIAATTAALKSSYAYSKLLLISYKVPNGVFSNRNSTQMAYNNHIYELRFIDQQSNILASYLTIATHPTVLNVQNKMISADLIAKLRNVYKSLYGIKPIVGLSDCADTSTRFTRKESSFTEIDRLGKLLKQALEDPQIIQSLNWDINSIKKIKQGCFYDPISSRLANETYKLIQNKYSSANCLKEKQNLKGLLDTYEHIRYYGHTHFNTHAYIYDFDNFRIVTYPGELVNALGQKIRNHDDKFTFLITLANDYRGYSVNSSDFGKYFETYNSVFLKGMADDFVDNIISSY